jgi:hypothetical protein
MRILFETKSCLVVEVFGEVSVQPSVEDTARLLMNAYGIDFDEASHQVFEALRGFHKFKQRLRIA